MDDNVFVLIKHLMLLPRRIIGLNVVHQMLWLRESKDPH